MCIEEALSTLCKEERDELREQGSGGDGDRVLPREAVGVHVRRLEDELEGMLRPEGSVEVDKRLGGAVARRLRLDEEPRPVVAGHEEVDPVKSKMDGSPF